MSKWLKIIIIVIIILLIIAAGYYFLILKKGGEESKKIESEPEGKEVVLPSQPRLTSPKEKVISPEKEKIQKKTNIANLAASFSERFGSYSNQSDYANVEDLKLLMTPKMRSWADKYVAEGRSKMKKGEPYFGVTTKALSTKIISESDDKAEVLVSTQRTEKRDEEENVYYQKITLKLIKEGGMWKVDSAEWGERE